jgi:hypothetical protein
MRRARDGLAFGRSIEQNLSRNAALPQREPSTEPGLNQAFWAVADLADLQGETFVAVPAPSTKAHAPATAIARSADPFRNPSYPKRVHFPEREELGRVLASCEERLSTAVAKLRDQPDQAKKSNLLRLYHQLQGARDQVAEGARRLPLEAAGLYHEDHERFQQATAAFERTWRQWEKAIA